MSKRLTLPEVIDAMNRHRAEQMAAFWGSADVALAMINSGQACVNAWQNPRITNAKVKAHLRTIADEEARLGIEKRAATVEIADAPRVRNTKEQRCPTQKTGIYPSKLSSSKADRGCLSGSRRTGQKPATGYSPLR